MQNYEKINEENLLKTDTDGLSTTTEIFEPAKTMETSEPRTIGE